MQETAACTYCDYLLGRHVLGGIPGENVRDAGAIVAGASGQPCGPYFKRDAHLEVGVDLDATSGAEGCECDDATLSRSEWRPVGGAGRSQV